MPSFGGEVKLSVPCRRFAACKRSLNLRGSQNLGKNYYWTSFLPTVPPFAARISCVVADGGTWRLKWECLKVGGKQWQTTPKNLPRMQCARAIPVTWLGSGSCQAWPSRLNTNEWWSYLLCRQWHVSATVGHLQVTNMYIEENYTECDHSTGAYS